MAPLPFYSLVMTRGPGSHVDANKPIALGVVTGRSEGDGGWNYAVLIGETTYAFEHRELIPLGCVLERAVLYGSDGEIEGLSAPVRLLMGDKTRTDRNSLEG